MKPVPSPSASCGPAPGAWAPALADLGPQHNRPVAVLVNRGQPGRLLWGVGSRTFYVPWTFKCLCPGCGDSGDPLPCRAGLPLPGRETLAQALADLCPVLCAEEGFAHPPGRSCWMPAGAGAGHDPVAAIFTSGSTGNSGIVIAHRSVIDFTGDGRRLSSLPTRT